MRSAAYIAGTGIETVPLNGGGIYIGDPNDLHGRSWDYTLGYRGISGAARAAREVSVPAVFTDPDAANRLRGLADRDVANATPGFIEVDGWRQRAYIVASAPDSIRGREFAAKLTVVLLDGVWHKSRTLRFTTEGSAGDDDLDLPYGIPYDLAKVPGLTSVTVSGATEIPASFVIYGQVDNLSIEIAGNVYKVAASVPYGARIEIDAIARTVKMTERDGTVTDLFAKAERGTGKGSGSYIFQPIPPGRHSVRWSGSFGFDLIALDEEGEPAW